MFLFSSIFIGPLNICKPCVSLALSPPDSPGKEFSHPEMLCWSVSIATTLSARRASTSTTQAPSSRKAFTPGNDLTHWPVTSHYCWPDLHHGKEKSTACPLLSDPQTDVDIVDVCQPPEEDRLLCEHLSLSPAPLAIALWDETGKTWDIIKTWGSELRRFLLRDFRHFLRRWRQSWLHIKLLPFNVERQLQRIQVSLLRHSKTSQIINYGCKRNKSDAS